MNQNLKSMREVARLANVSVATVSRALRDPKSVSKKSLSKVQEAAKQVGYTYNAAAGDLLAGRSTVLGILVPSVSNSLFGETLHGIQDTAMEAGFSVIQGVTGYDPAKERKLLETFISRRVHGLVLTGLTDTMRNQFDEVMLDNGVRTVVIWESPRSTEARSDLLSYVGFDNFEASKTATEYLIGLGHKRIGLICGPGSMIARARHRFDGYAEALQKAGIPFDPDLVAERLPDLTHGREALISLMSLEDKPSAIFAASDILAIGAIRGAHELGLQIPQDISIVGFDDLEISAFQQPPLTTMKVDGYKIGTLAAQVAIENFDLPLRHYCLDTDLVVRRSSGPPKEVS